MCMLLCQLAVAQSFEIVELQESYKGGIGEVIMAPVLFQNHTSKPLTLIIRKTSIQIGTSQKNYFCHNGQCLDPAVNDYVVKIEAGQTLNTLHIALEAGLVPGISAVKYIAYNRANPAEAVDLDFNFLVEEKPVKKDIYNSRHISLREVYPNPTFGYAYVDYNILDDLVSAKMILYNVLGNPVDEFDLPVTENKVKISTAHLDPGIYFYTLYLDGDAVTTRKLVVKK